jgi:hypothetical protein
MGYEVELIGFTEQTAKLHASAEIIDRRARNAMVDALHDVEAAVIPLVPVNQGRLKNSMGSRVTGGIRSVTGIFGSSIKEPYPEVMELGSKPFFPPPEALERWAQLKFGLNAVDAKALAFLVARKISRVGIKGRFFIQRGFEKAKDSVLGRFASALRLITEDLSNGRS